MKIVIASDLYWPTVNGVSVACRTLAHGLADAGHDVLVLAPSQTGEHYTEQDGKTTIVRLKSTIFPFYHNQIDKLPEKRVIGRFSVPTVYSKNGFRVCLTPRREIKAVLDEFQPDIIHNHMYLIIGQAVSAYARDNNIPIVFTNHVVPDNLLDNLRLLAPFSRPINRAMTEYGVRFLGKSDYIIMPTEAAIELNAKEVAGVKCPVEAVSNGIDLSRFSPQKPDSGVYAKYGLPTNKPIVMYLGRVDVEKHISVLVQAFAQVQEQTDSYLAIIGAGTDEEFLKHLAEDLEIGDKVVFSGRVSDEDKIELLRTATVYCMPSPAELQSISTLEAMACGQPVVAVDAGAVKELCQNERNGFLCAKDNADEMADGIKKIIQDPALRKRFAAESLKIASTHDIAHTIAKVVAIYDKVIAARQG
jgi:glycosyltransferase involved in cell wall biosynthesis